MLNGHFISALLPALNEEKNIGRVIEALPEFIDQVFVVNDGSTDRTAEVAAEKGAIVITHAKNKGVGAALNSGIRHILTTQTDILVNLDADGQFNPEDIIHIVQPILDKKAQFVTASRFKDKELKPKMPRAKYLGNQFMSRFISRLTGEKFHDVSCGFRAYDREALNRLNLFGEFTYTQETFIDLAFKNIDIAEIPVVVRGQREFGKSRVASNLFRYGWQTLKIIIRTYRDNKPFRLFGFASALSALTGLGFGIFLLVHFIQNGQFTPHKWAGFTSGFFLVVALLLLLMGFILDMFARMRKTQEEILYQLKKKQSDA